MTIAPITQSLDRALAELEAAKAAETEATLRRNKAENAVLALAGELPKEGTHRLPAGNLVAVIQTSIRRTVDADKLSEIAPQIPEAIGKRLFRWKPELETRELRYLEANEPQLYSIVAAAITAKPAKPSIRLERKEAA